ncbi:MAG: hypothetical protein SPI30_08620 [Prevotella sp.]|nr:hypothetical protein [Prevotella sp.]
MHTDAILVESVLMAASGKMVEDTNVSDEMYNGFLGTKERTFEVKEESDSTCGSDQL